MTPIDQMNWNTERIKILEEKVDRLEGIFAYFKKADKLL